MLINPISITVPNLGLTLILGYVEQKSWFWACRYAQDRLDALSSIEMKQVPRVFFDCLYALGHLARVVRRILKAALVLKEKNSNWLRRFELARVQPQKKDLRRGFHCQTEHVLQQIFLEPKPGGADYQEAAMKSATGIDGTKLVRSLDVRLKAVAQQLELGRSFRRW